MMQDPDCPVRPGPDRRRVALLARFAAIVLLCTPSANAAAPFSSGMEDIAVDVYLKADPATRAPFLSLDPAQATAAQYVVSPDAGAGALQAAQALTWGTAAPVAATFTLPTGLPETCYLNLTRDVQGHVEPVNAARESLRFTVEVFEVTRRVAGHVILDDVSGLNAHLYDVSAHAEARLLEAGKELSVKVTQWTGPGTFTIKLHSPPAAKAFLRFWCIPYDPLAGALYLENGILVSSPTSSTPPPLLPGPASGGDAASLIPLGLLAGGRAARRRALTPALLVVFAFAGCTSTPPDGTPAEDEPGARSPNVEIGYQGNESLETRGLGSIRGFVRDGERGGVPPLPNVHVTILGTSLFTDSDGHGSFGLDGILARNYTLKFDRKGYESIEVPAPVKVGSILFLNVTLYALSGSNLDNNSQFKPHTHPEWDLGETSRPIQDVYVPPSAVRGTSGQGGAVGESWYCIQAPGNQPGKRSQCEGEAPIDVSKTVLPGTTEVEVVLTWDTTDQKLAPPAFGLRFENLARNHTRGPGGSELFPTTFMPRPPGDPFRIAIFPNEADPGHQAYTDWQFWAIIPNTWLNRVFIPPSPTGATVYVGTAIRVQVTIYKGVEPLEPSHPNFWNGTNEVRLIDTEAKNMGILSEYPDANNAWEPAPEKFVPPGTRTVRGWLNMTPSDYTAGLPDPTNTQWSLRYLAADRPLSTPPEQWEAATLEQEDDPGHYAFTIDVPPAKTDQYYHAASHWRFAVEDGKEPVEVAALGAAYAVAPNGGHRVKAMIFTATAYGSE